MWTFVSRPSGNLKPYVLKQVPVKKNQKLFALFPLYKLSIENLEFTIFMLSAKKLVALYWRSNLYKYLR